MTSFENRQADRIAENGSSGDCVTAALLIIGDEILSGRTKDANLSYLAIWLNEIGIQIHESRIVQDDRNQIAAALNDLRVKYDYIFTTGGIGPTHDDITVDSIAFALGVDVVIDPEADKLLHDYYGDADYTPARRRMARIPAGASLISNPVTIAPGIMVENIFIMAGVPKIMQGMLEGTRPHLKGGNKIFAKTVTIRTRESQMADALSFIQERHNGVTLGSYPFFKDGKGGTQIVARSSDQEAIDKAIVDVINHAEKENYDYQLMTE